MTKAAQELASDEQTPCLEVVPDFLGNLVVLLHHGTGFIRPLAGAGEVADYRGDCVETGRKRDQQPSDGGIRGALSKIHAEDGLLTEDLTLERAPLVGHVAVNRPLNLPKQTQRVCRHSAPIENGIVVPSFLMRGCPASATLINPDCRHYRGNRADCLYPCGPFDCAGGRQPVRADHEDQQGCIDGDKYGLRSGSHISDTAQLCYPVQRQASIRGGEA